MIVLSISEKVIYILIVDNSCYHIMSYCYSVQEMAMKIQLTLLSHNNLNTSENNFDYMDTISK